MILTIDYPEVILVIWSFILGFVLGAGLFAGFFYRERKRMMKAINTSSQVNEKLSYICDDLINRVNLLSEDVNAQQLELHRRKRKK